MTDNEEDAKSLVDERQPFHRVDGKLIEQREWKERLRLAEEVLEAFKRQARLDHEL
jgi:hypothetical protein